MEEETKVKCRQCRRFSSCSVKFTLDDSIHNWCLDRFILFTLSSCFKNSSSFNTSLSKNLSKTSSSSYRRASNSLCCQFILAFVLLLLHSSQCIAEAGIENLPGSSLEVPSSLQSSAGSSAESASFSLLSGQSDSEKHHEHNTDILTSGIQRERVIRSYSEEFMTSSEERERGAQFFGGISAGGSPGGGSSSSGGGGSGGGSTAAKHHRLVPFFDTDTLSTNVTISEGTPFVHLPCRVRQLSDRTLSWIRRKDLQILTVGKFTYTSDQRFQTIHLDGTDDWTLQISYPQKSDAGTYECQVAALPKMSLFVELNVVVSKARILEGPTLYLSSGSTLNLTCVVKDTPGPPDYIFWYYNGEVINYGSARDIKVQTEKSTSTISKLVIGRALPNDSGNYSCTPSNADAAHIAVHVNSNSNPAASIQPGKRSAREFGSNNSSDSSAFTLNPTPLVWLTLFTILISSLNNHFRLFTMQVQ